MKFKIEGLQKNTLVWRQSLVRDGFDPNSPDYTANPEDEAVRMLSRKYEKYWPAELDRTVVWLKNCNEIRTQSNPGDVWYKNLAPGEWWGQYALSCAQYAVSNNVRVVLLSPSAGDYEYEYFEQPSMLEFLRYAIVHPDHVIVGLHEYSHVAHNLFALIGNDNATCDDLLAVPLSDYWKLKIGRFRMVFEVCDKHQLGGWPMLFFPEWGWALDKIPDTDDAIAQIIEAAKRLYGPYYKYIAGCGTWYLGVSGVFGGRDVAIQTNSLLKPVAEVAVNQKWTVEEKFPSSINATIPPTTESDPVTEAPRQTETPPVSKTPERAPAQAPVNLIQNGNFEEGWQDLDVGHGGLRNQQPNGWTLSWSPLRSRLWARNLKSGDFPETATVPECVIKLNSQLPANEQVGGENALILDGTRVYKLFARGPWGAILSQSLTNLTPSMKVRVSVTVQVHYPDVLNDDSPDDMEMWLTVGSEKSVANAIPDLPDHQWATIALEGMTDRNGRLQVELRFQTKWANHRDVFIDNVTAVYVA